MMPLHNFSNIICNLAAAYLLSTSCRFLNFTNNWSFLNHWEMIFSCTIPLRELIIRDWCWSQSCLLWPGSGVLLRALIRSRYWDCTRPSFISQYDLFLGPYFMSSNKQKDEWCHCEAREGLTGWLCGDWCLTKCQVNKKGARWAGDVVCYRNTIIQFSKCREINTAARRIDWLRT